MATNASDIVDKVLRELADEDGAQYTHQNVLYKLWEAIKEISLKLKVFKTENYVIPLAADQDVWSMASDFLGVIRLGIGKNNDAMINRPRQHLDQLGSDLLRTGLPSCFWNDGVEFRKIGVWPRPTSSEVPSSALVTATDGDGKVFSIVAATDLTGHMILDYYRTADLPSPLTTHNGTSYSNDGALDSSLPDELYDKFYLLVAALVAEGSRDQVDRQRAKDFRYRYMLEFFNPIKEHHETTRYQSASVVL